MPEKHSAQGLTHIKWISNEYSTIITLLEHDTNLSNDPLLIYFFASLAVSNFFFSPYEVIYACAYVFNEYI